MATACDLDAPPIIWITGLSGSGKTTLATALINTLASHGIPAVGVDGDVVRLAFNPDLGFDEESRAKNVFWMGQYAKTIAEQQGRTVVVSAISPFATHRDAVREMFAPTQFVEVFMDTSIEVCEKRDPKGCIRQHGWEPSKTLPAFRHRMNLQPSQRLE